jgi:FkbM family methyltransferase
MKKIIKKIIRFLLPPRIRIMAFWRLETSRLSLASAYNRPRSHGEYAIAKKFRRYFLENIDSFEYLISRLKKGLDEKSQKEVDLSLKRQEYVLTHNLFRQNFVFKPQELTEQKACSEIVRLFEKDTRRLNLKHSYPEAIYGLSGLRWLPKEAKDRLANGVFLDIGAYDGDSALALGLAFNPKKIYAFEPENANYSRLKNNAEILGGGKIVAIQSGISDITGTGRIKSQDSSSLVGEEGEKITLETIDDFIAKNNQEHVNLIKMDIEGEELKALKGAINTIKRDRPILAISIYHQPEDFFGIKPWLEEVAPGYKFLIKKANPFSLNLEIMLIAY